MRIIKAALVLAVLNACGDDEKITSEKKVSLIYDNFQPTMDKIIEQGLLAKDASVSGANITAFSVAGDKAGTMTIGGKIAQSSGANENFELWVQLEGPYSDTDKVFYATNNTDDTTKLQFGLQIKGAPTDNTMSGTLEGPLSVSGEDVDGTATFALTFVSDLDDNDESLTVICSRVTGTVKSGGETKSVDFVLPKELSGLDEVQVSKCTSLSL